MDSRQIIAALKELRIPHDEIARVISRDRSAATKMLSGKRSVKAQELAPLSALIAAYRGDSGELPRLPETPSPPPGQSAAIDAPLALLPVRDRAQAGAWLLADDVSQVAPRMVPVVRDPRYPDANQWLTSVTGDSMDLLRIYDGDLVHCVDAIAIDYHPRSGDIVEVERLRFGGRERELTIKEVRRFGGRVLLQPRSSNPRWKDPLELTNDAAEEEIEVRIRGLVLQVTRVFGA